MTTMREERDRLIRFENLDVKGKPNLLSWYEADKNLLHIDRLEALPLPPAILNQLLFTEHEFTRTTSNGNGFEPYSRPAGRH